MIVFLLEGEPLKLFSASNKFSSKLSSNVLIGMSTSACTILLIETCRNPDVKSPGF